MCLEFWFEKLNERDFGKQRNEVEHYIQIDVGNGMFIRDRTRIRMFCCELFFNLKVLSDARNPLTS
jgi:hypothetical protein